jgi:hypothetical protein
MYLPAGLFTGLRQRFQQPLPSLDILENRFSPVAPIHHRGIGNSGIGSSPCRYHYNPGVLESPSSTPGY